MLTEEHRKEDLSRAYVQAVAAVAGVIVSINNRSHDYGMDGSFHEVSLLNGQRVESGITLDFQLKATTRVDAQNDFVAFSLDAKTINLLVDRTKRPAATPAILIILSLPKEPDEWLKLSERELILKNCCYWSHISSLTNNLYAATQRVSRDQLFNPGALSNLLGQFSKRVQI
ncbi:MAG: DUF4365 domain-containing protein [Rhabdochlamydiaceae bacterium]